MLTALDRHLKVLDYKYSIIQTIVNARGKNRTSSPARKREETEAASALTSEEEILWTAKISAIPVEEFFLRRCGGKQLRAANVERQSIIQVTSHANEKSPNDYDEIREREHRELLYT